MKILTGLKEDSLSKFFSRRTVSRVLYWNYPTVIIYLVFSLPKKSSNLPERSVGFPTLLFGFAPDRVFQALNVTIQAVSSYLTFSPLPKNWRYIFCCTFRKLTPPRCYLAPCSMKSGLSSKIYFSNHPTNSSDIIMIFYFSISFLYISLLFSPVKMEINFAESDADNLDKNSFFIFSLIFENGFGLF